MPGSSNPVDNEKDIADIQGNVAAEIGIKLDVAHGAFPHTVEVDANRCLPTHGRS